MHDGLEPINAAGLSFFGGWRSQSWTGPAVLTIGEERLILGPPILLRAWRFSASRPDVAEIWIVDAWNGRAIGIHSRAGRINKNLFFPFNWSRCQDAFAIMKWQVEPEHVTFKAFRRICGDSR